MRAVTDGEFWKRVGEELQRRRMKRGLKSTNAVQTAGGPSYKTVAAIEAGNVGELRPLIQYMKVVDLSLVDLFRSVLQIEADEQSPELEFVIRTFKNSGLAARDALVSTARLAEEGSAARSPAALPAPPATPKETRRAEPSTPKRRGQK